MDHVIAEYQKWKAQGESLRAQAKQAMEARFRDLLTEAAQIAQEFQRDFGGGLKPPAQITAFRFKASGAKAVKKAAAGKSSMAKTVAETPAKNGAKTPALDKKLAQARARLEAAKAAGKPTKNLEDRIYEIEDEIRLANQN